MVVSTMAALIVLVTAMYMSVLSSRQVQYATFDQEQAYVTSTSVADVLRSYICDNSNSGTELVKSVVNLNEGESISTNGNDFASLVESGSKSDTVLGAYSATITRLKDETVAGTKWYVYDIAVTASKNGIVETTHTYMKTKDPEPPEMGDIDRFFTATGYVPNDVALGNGNYFSKLYFESEVTTFTDIKGTASADLKLNVSIVCAGSAIFDREKATVNVADTTDWYFGNNLTFKGEQPTSIDLKGKNDNCDSVGSTEIPDHGKIVVGGDFYWNPQTKYGGQWGTIGADNKYTDVYVIGDCYLARATIHGNLYVGGNLYFMSNDDNKVDGNLYVDGECLSAEGVTNGHINKTPQKWTPGEGETGFVDKGDYTYTKSEMIAELSAKVAPSTYPKFEVDTSNMRNGSGEGGSQIYRTVDIHFKNDTGTDADNYVYKIDQDCVIGDISSVGNQVSYLTIVIDTGGKDDIRTIRLSNNDGDQFRWTTSDIEHGYVNVITVGEGTLVVDVPEGVRYQAGDQEFFGHLGWFLLMGGKVTTKNGNEFFSRDGFNMGQDSVRNILSSVIHGTYFDYGQHTCSCKYEIPADGSSNMYKCTNSDHAGEYSEKPEECQCSGYIEKSSVRSYATSKGIDLDYDGKEQIPNVNIYLVSCNESADMQFATDISGTTIQNDMFFGYVYAPYMTYFDVDTGGSGGVRMVGGLIVSDYVVSGYYDYVFCRPTKNINEILETTSDDPEALQATGNRDWLIYGV